MKLREFLNRTGISIAELAHRCDLTFHQVYHVLNGGIPKLKTAIIISKYSKNPRHRLSDGCIEPQDFLPDEVLLEIENKHLNDEKKNNDVL